MSVIIKGINEPKECWPCVLAKQDGTGWKYCPILGRGVHKTEPRPSDCPVHEIPTPHGRLIDADELMAEIPVRKPGSCATVGDVYEAYYAINVATTIIEAEGEGCLPEAK